MLVVMLMLTGCKDYAADTVLADGEPVVANLALSVSSQAAGTTRMDAGVVQADGQSFRGLTDLHLIPFSCQGAVTSSDTPLPPLTELTQKTTASVQIFLYEAKSMQTGTASFLAYGKAPAGGKTMAQNGSLRAFGLASPTTAGSIIFEPDPFLSTNDTPADANTIASLLSDIANAEAETEARDKWSASTNKVLKLLYERFTGKKDDGSYSLMAGSKTSLNKHVEALKTALTEAVLTGTPQAIKGAVLSKIADYESGVPDYPANKGLPDGAAAVRWTGTAFSPQTVTTTIDNLNNISRFCYPAELCYRANSRIRTSATLQTSYTTASNWDTILSGYDAGNGIVTAGVKSVAILDPLQYAVAQLQVVLKQAPPTLTDGAGKNLAVGSATFPLTGLIVTGQRKVDFEFKPTDNVNEYFAYDNQVPAGTALSATADASPVATLLLQSKNEEVLKLVLEFRNDSGQSFQGKDGIVYPGTKFYLVGELTPTNTTDDYTKRVLTQDYTTVVNVTVLQTGSLSKAYNVLPDLLASTLEIGVELTPKWVQTKTTVIME